LRHPERSPLFGFGNRFDAWGEVARAIKRRAYAHPPYAKPISIFDAGLACDPKGCPR
jgi:hypothetical protein